MLRIGASVAQGAPARHQHPPGRGPPAARWSRRSLRSCRPCPGPRPSPRRPCLACSLGVGHADQVQTRSSIRSARGGWSRRAATRSACGPPVVVVPIGRRRAPPCSPRRRRGPVDNDVLRRTVHPWWWSRRAAPCSAVRSAPWWWSRRAAPCSAVRSAPWWWSRRAAPCSAVIRRGGGPVGRRHAPPCRTRHSSSSVGRRRLLRRSWCRTISPAPRPGAADRPAGPAGRTNSRHRIGHTTNAVRTGQRLRSPFPSSLTVDGPTRRGTFEHERTAPCQRVRPPDATFLRSPGPIRAWPSTADPGESDEEAAEGAQAAASALSVRRRPRIALL